MRLYHRDKIVFNLLGYSFISVLAIFCVLPFILVVSGSFTSEDSIIKDGYSVFPKVFSLEAYTFIFKIPKRILNSYLVTILLTASGTSLSLFFCTMTAYVLQRQQFKCRNIFALYFYFTTLFSGGLVPWYILMIKYLNKKKV